MAKPADPTDDADNPPKALVRNAGNDPPGPMARSMTDVALLLDIMAGLEQYDNLTWNGPDHYPQDGYSEQITNDGQLE
ncbi:hypothetical protein DL771_008009 [Monosporascus sp. 5C6A]|nr:hypothetical protein DL771_008009 [Monosporascus sp. 5C6A]